MDRLPIPGERLKFVVKTTAAQRGYGLYEGDICIYVSEHPSSPGSLIVIVDVVHPPERARVGLYVYLEDLEPCSEPKPQLSLGEKWGRERWGR